MRILDVLFFTLILGFNGYSQEMLEKSNLNEL